MRRNEVHEMPEFICHKDDTSRLTGRLTPLEEALLRVFALAIISAIVIELIFG